MAALTARPAWSFPNRAALGLPRLSMPNKTSGEGQVVAGVEWFAFAVMIALPGIKKGPGQGPWGFMGYGPGSGLVGGRADLARNNGHSSSDDELHNDITTTNSCCQ